MIILMFQNELFNRKVHFNKSIFYKNLCKICKFIKNFKKLYVFIYPTKLYNIYVFICIITSK